MRLLTGKGVDADAEAPSACLVGVIAGRGGRSVALSCAYTLRTNVGSSQVGAQWLHKAAARGNARAMHEVAQCYLTGTGVVANALTAVQ